MYFADIIIGHFLGDYMLQNDWMAEQKKKHLGLGWWCCSVHCFIYTMTICLCTANFDFLWIAWVFATHFIVDKSGFIEWYSKLIGSRSIGDFMSKDENKEYSPHTGLRAGVTVFVFIVRDNTVHVAMMYYFWKWLYI